MRFKELQTAIVWQNIHRTYFLPVCLAHSMSGLQDLNDVPIWPDAGDEHPFHLGLWTDATNKGCHVMPRETSKSNLA